MQPVAPVPPSPVPPAGPAPAGSGRTGAIVVLVVLAVALAALLGYLLLVSRSADSVGPATSSVPTTTGVFGPVTEPKVVKSAIDDPGEIETVTLPLRQGDQLRVKVVPTAPDLDPEVGLAMPRSGLVTDFFEDGFTGNETSLFKDQIELLYGDTEPPATTVPILANDNSTEGIGEWLDFVAPTDATYAVIVRGKGDTTGAYVLTMQSRSSTKPVPGVDRLDGHDDWMDRDAAATRAAEATDFLTDRAFFSDAQFTEDGAYKGPDATAVQRTFRSLVPRAPAVVRRR